MKNSKNSILSTNNQILNDLPSYNENDEDVEDINDNYNQNYRTIENIQKNNKAQPFDKNIKNQLIKYSNLEGNRKNIELNYNNNEFSNKNNNQDDFDEHIEDNNEMQQTIKYPYHFQTKIRNNGFWGKVKLRNGTWLVIIGLILFSISIILIGVFWGFWYSHALNYPFRVVAITLLSLGISFILFGLISNYIMLKDSSFKEILGSPLRKSTYFLITTLFMLVIASDLITVYYTYWQNRWVNTPLIIVAIILYFFGGIGLIIVLKHICRMNLVRYGFIDEDTEKSFQENDFDLKKIDSINKDNKQIERSWINIEGKESELNINEINNELDQTFNSTSTSRNFRKKMLKLTPKPVVII